MIKYQNIYKDRWLLTLIPVFGLIYRHMGETEPLHNLLSNKTYYLDILTSVIVIGVIWFGVRIIISKLDTLLPWEANALSRASIQGLLTFGFAIILTSLVSYFYNEQVMTRAPEFNLAVVFSYDVPFACLMITIIQLTYGLLYMKGYYEFRLETQSGALSPYSTVRKTLMAKFGHSVVPVPTETVAFLIKVGEFTQLKTFTNKDYSMDESLDQLEEWLGGENFFRVNRQCIAHRKTIISIKSDVTGKLHLELAPKPSEEVSVSRKKAQEFKSWMER